MNEKYVNSQQTLFYISPRDMRKNRSDAVHIMLSCQGFAQTGLNVTLVTPKVKRKEYNKSFDEIFSLFGIEQQSFKVIELLPELKEKTNHQTSTIFTVLSKLLGHFLFITINLRKIRPKGVIIYSKCFTSTIPYLVFKKCRLIKSKIVFETITPKNSYLHRFIFRNTDKIISHLKYVTEDVKAISGITGENIFEPPLMTQSKEITCIKESKQEIRSKFGWDTCRNYVLYAGKTGEKTLEVDYFISAAKICKEQNFVIVGANEKAFKRYKDRIEQEHIQNLIIFPFQLLTDYYRFVLAADVLVGYYPATEHNKYHLSPGKSGIYLASKNPCIFSDLPSLRSIYPADTVFYAKPDDPKELAKTINFVLSNNDVSKDYASKAYNFARESTYENFALAVVHFINQN
jgi:glycosyltransferase involved in cell wall biosynthesis